MKGICLIWSRGRHISPSLPDLEPTGICSRVHSVSDLRGEISGILVMERRSSTTSRGTGCSVFVFLSPGYLVCACALFLELKYLP